MAPFQSHTPCILCRYLLVILKSYDVFIGSYLCSNFLREMSGISSVSSDLAIGSLWYGLAVKFFESLIIVLPKLVAHFSK